MRPGAGLHIYYKAGTFTWSCSVELRWQRPHLEIPLPPAHYRSFTSIQMEHTHAPPQRGRWNDNESEVTMKMKWTLPNQDAKRGTQKKRDRENTNTTHLARNGQTLKRQEKEKRRPTDNGTRPAEGGEGRKRLNQPNKAKPKPTPARAGPNLPEGRRTQAHMR